MQTPPTILTTTSDIAPTTGTASGTPSTLDIFTGDPFAVIFARLIQGNPAADLTQGVPQPSSLPTPSDAEAIPSTARTTETVTETSPFAQFTARNLSQLLAGLPEMARNDEKGTTETTLVSPGDATIASDLLALFPELASLVGNALPTSSQIGPQQAGDLIPGGGKSSFSKANTSLLAGLTSPTTTDASTTAASSATAGATAEKSLAPAFERRLQPFQVAPLVNPRFTDPLAPLGSRKGDDSSSGTIPGTPSLESLLGGSRSGRIVVDKNVLNAVDKLLRRSAPASDILERGASILTPEELKSQTTSTTEDRNATALARVDRNEFVNRVVQALERAHTEQPKTIEVELNPPSLGKLRLQVTQIDGQITAKIEVHSDASRSLLLDNLPALDRQLGEQGVQIQRFTVDHMNTGPSASADLSGNAQQQAQQEAAQEQQRQSYRSASADDGQNDNESNRGSGLTVSDLLRIADGMDRLV
jgi:flagellar hook-length control protein FliK